MSAALETARMLASLLGIDEAEATIKLNRTILITASQNREAWAAEIATLAGRTVTTRRDLGSGIDLELVIGGAEPRSNAQCLYADIGAEQLIAGSSSPAMPAGDPQPLFAVATAPIIAAMAIRGAISDSRLPAVRDPLNLHEREFGIPSLRQGKIVPLDDVVMVGAGAVAHGFLRALRHVPVRGSIDIVDPKTVGPGNLNRCLYLHEGDEGGDKAELLVARAAPDFPAVHLQAFKQEFADYAKGKPPAATMVVTVDSRVARRKLQKFLPGCVLDASTTDVRFVVVHSNHQPAEGACLACLYRHTPDENARETSIAEALGLDVATIRTGFITPEVAQKIVERYPDRQPGDLVGKAFDSLFRELCATQALAKPEGRQVFTPFAFVSAMAGALLAIELVRRNAGYPDTGGWQVDPWRGPVGRTRRSVPKAQDCEVCSETAFRDAIQRFWGTGCYTV